MLLGATVKLSNRAEFSKGLMAVTQQIQKYKAAVGLASAETAKNSNSFESLQKRILATGNLLEAQKTLYSQLRSRLETLRTQHQENGKVHKNLINYYQAEKEKLTTLGNTLGKSSSEYQAQEKIVQSLGEKVKISAQNHEKNQKEIETTEVKLIKANTAYLKTEKSINNLNEKLKDNVVASAESDKANRILLQVIEKQEKKLNRLKERYQKVSQEQGENSKSAKALENSINKLNTSITDNKEKLKSAAKETREYSKSAHATEGASSIFVSGANLMQGAVIGLGMSIAQWGVDKLKELVTSTIEVGMEFEAGMSKVEALSGATGKDLEALNLKAQELGRTTQYTAVDFTEMFKYMALAGWDTHQMLEGIDGIWQLAAASGEDFARVSDIVTDALTAMGYKASDSTKFVDILATTTANSNTNVTQMGEAFQYVAPIVGNLNYSIEDLSLAMGILADNGIKGEKAGVALRNIITRLIDPPKKAKEWIDKLGISVKDSQGNMLPFSAVISQLREKFSKLSEAQKVEAATSIVGKQAVAGFLSIVNTAPANLTKLKTAIDQSEGAGKKMADTMINNGKGAVTLLKSKVENLQVALHAKLKPAFNGVIDVANGAVDVFKLLIDNSRVVVTAIAAIGAGLLAFKVAGPIILNLGIAFKTWRTQLEVAKTAATGFFTSFSAGLFSVQGAAAIFSVLAVAMLSVIQANEQYKKSLTEADDWIKDQREKINQLVESRDKLVEVQQKSIDSNMTEMTNATVLAEELNTLVDANGKVKEGYKERAQFITTELSKALGIEIQNNNGIIKNYKDIQKEIQSTIAKKKAKMIVDSQEVLYVEAMKGQATSLSKQRDLEKQLNEKYVERAKYLKKVSEIQEKMKKVMVSAPNARTAEFSVAALRAELAEVNDALEKNKTNIEELKGQHADIKNLNDKYAFDTAQYYKNAELMANGHYDKMTNISWTYMEQFKNTEDAKLREKQAALANEQDLYKVYQENYEKTNDEMYKKQMEASESRQKQLKEEMKAYISTVGEKLRDINDLWNEETTKTLNELTGKTWTFQQNGEGHVIAYANGIEQKTGTAEEVMNYLVNDVLKTAEYGEPKAKDEGEKITENLAEGMESKQDAVKSAATEAAEGAIQSVNSAEKGFHDAGLYWIAGLSEGIFDGIGFLFGRIWDLGVNLVKTLKRAVDERSPSKATFKIGKFFTQGLALGIAEDASNLYKQTEKLGQNVTGALQKNIGAAKLQHVQFGLSHNVGALANRRSFPANMRANTWTSGSYNGEVEWEKVLTNAFTAALYKMQDKFEIKLNGERIGEFVDKRVDNLIYQ